MSAIVLDAGGRVKAFQKQDRASMLRFEICYGKAYGALALGRPSKLVLQKARKSRYSCSPWRVSPIIRCFLKAVVNSSATGRASCCAVGITGDANEPDDLCAIAGIHAAKLCADSDFFDDPDLMRAVSIHKSAPLVDPRPKTKSRAPALRADRNGSTRNGSTRPGANQTAKSGP